MPKNLEIKAPVAAPDELRSKILALPAVPTAILGQRDTYFAVPNGRLKLREIAGLPAELIYYQRGEESKERVSDFDIFRCTDPCDLLALLRRAFGVRSVVEKRRELFMYNDTRIHLDQVNSLGWFLEFEIPVQDNDGGEGQKTLQFLIRELGLDNTAFIHGSYIDLLEAVRG